LIDAALNLPGPLQRYLIAVLRDKMPLPLTAALDEWEQLIPCLNQHGISSLLYYKIKHLPKNLHPPGEIMHKIRNIFMLNSLKSIQMENQIAEISAAFNKQGIKTLVLKGLAFGKSVYPDPGTRPFCDLDILVLPHDVLKTRETLVKLGYKCKDKTYDRLKRLEIEEQFVHSNSPATKRMVEVHWDLHGFHGEMQHIPVKEYFKRSICVDGFNTLNPGDALVYAAIHMLLIHNQSFRLLWIYDIGLLAKQIKEWDILIERSKAMGALIAVKQALKLAEYWTGFKLPQEIIWPEPTKKESKTWNQIISRQKSIYTWFRIRWPKGLNWFESINLLKHFYLDRKGKS